MSDKIEGDFLVVIPARYNSSRFPGKPLAEICGKSMLERVYEKCCEAVEKSLVIVATDDERIRLHCQKKRMNVVMTSDACLTGTDRVAEVARQIKRSYYINVQGDEPLISADDLKKVLSEVSRLSDKVNVFNAMTEINTEDEFFNPHIPKVVFDESARLMYMSRAGVPLSKQGKFVQGYKQVCIYGFERATLLEVMNNNVKAPNESIEDIEILRFLEKGYDVQMVPVSGSSVAVDTIEDLERVRKIISEKEV